MIDTQTPQSPGWWMTQLAGRLTHPRRQQRFLWLESYYRGSPDLPSWASPGWKPVFQSFQAKSQSNFAALIVDAPLSMMQVRAIRTSQASDDVGDKLAWSYYRRNRLPVQLRDWWRHLLTVGESYMSVGMPAAPEFVGEVAAPVIAVEDPRQVFTLDDPVTGRARAALKLFADPVTGEDFCYLWLPGQMWVASRPMRTLALRRPVPMFDASFTLREDLSAQWSTPTVPMVKIRNHDGKGEFEGVKPILDRINHMLLQRVVIATFQAHRQRAIKVDPQDMPDTDPDTGEEIDYDDILAADPGALWKLPKDAELWESAQADLTPMLTAVKDDVLHLAAITRTPLTMFTPDAATQTAEGAQLQREGLVFKVADLQVLSEAALAEVFSLAFTFAGQPERAQIDQIGIDFRPAERYSLAERSSAAVQAAQAGVPWRTRMTDIYQFPPDKVDRMDAERNDDALFAATTGQQQVPLSTLAPTASVADRLAAHGDHLGAAVG